jgi:hypothetical protein
MPRKIGRRPTKSRPRTAPRDLRPATSKTVNGGTFDPVFLGGVQVAAADVNNRPTLKLAR